MKKFDIRDHKFTLIIMYILLVFILVVANAFKYIPITEKQENNSSEEFVYSNYDNKQEDITDEDIDEEDLEENSEEELKDNVEKYIIEFKKNTPFRELEDNELD